MATPSRITGARETECPECNGLGYTHATCDDMQTRKVTREEHEQSHVSLPPVVEMRTIRKGSGCPRCLGTGQLMPRMH
jgi:hypothetical protein